LRLEIVGHADPRKRQSGTNEGLARHRAESVREAVHAWITASAPHWSRVPIDVRSDGARELARKCEAGDGAEARACHAFNRRVVVQIVTGPQP
jgi:outer membrane protein OmpA-like peptidoglycan-associated protein